MTIQDRSIYTIRESEPTYINDKGKEVNLYFDPNGRRVIYQKKGDRFVFVTVEDYNRNRIPSIYVKTNKTRGRGIIVYSSYMGDYYKLEHGDRYKKLSANDYSLLMYDPRSDSEPNTTGETALNELKIVIHRMKNDSSLKVFYMFEDKKVPVKRLAIGKKVGDDEMKKMVIIDYKSAKKKRACDITRTCIIQHNKRNTIYICEAKPSDMQKYVNALIENTFPLGK
jgi:hypothetical protein